MSRTDNYDALLTVCIQDLHAGEVLLRDTLPKVAKHANAPKLAELLTRLHAEAESAASALADTGRQAGGADNLWMKGICQDSRRDTRSIVRGPLLDAAIVGAIRKAKAAQIVSYDTAIAIAGALRQDAIRDMLRDVRKAALSANRRLAVHLPAS